MRDASLYNCQIILSASRVWVVSLCLQNEFVVDFDKLFEEWRF